MNKNFLLNLEYKGTNYFGWQIQNNSDQKTIQGILEKSIKEITKIETFKTLGSSRTDRGVHAFDQYCKLDIDCNISNDSLKKALNDILPNDIRIKSIDTCSENFHPIFMAEKKTYHYLFTDSLENIPIQFCDLIHLVPYKLNLIKMSQAANMLLGSHDFKNFQCVGSNTKTSVRKIFSSEIKSLRDVENIFGFRLKNTWSFRIEGNGFLKQMVRLLMGGIFNVGREKISLDEFNSILNNEIESRAGKVVGPEGLYLTHIKFKKSE